MAFKYFALCVLVTVAAAQYHGYGIQSHDQHNNEHHVPANYEFGYSVHDEHTGDIKSQHESRHEDQVKGRYSLVEPDGHVRIVDYSADAHNGFNAVVHREGHQSHHAAPAHNHVAIPVAHHAAPLAQQVRYVAAPAVHGYSSGHSAVYQNSHLHNNYHH